jgi:integrase
MSLVRLNQQFIGNNLFTHENKSRVEYCDTELPGLYVEVRASNEGHGTYYLRYKDSTGKTCHQKLGKTTDIDLAEARKRTRHLKAEISLGANPRGEVKKGLAVITFDKFFVEHYLPYVKPRKRSWRRDEEIYRLRVRAVFGNRRLNEITQQQVASFHNSLVETGLKPATADLHARFLKHAFNLAIDFGLLNEKNPAARVAQFRPDNRIEHYLDEAQLQRLLHVLQTDANRPVCQIALFLLSTGARLNEALSAKWGAQMDRENRVWRIPASNSKSKKIRSVPLNDSALEVLAQLNTEGQFEHVFINSETKKPYTTISKVWLRLRAKAGLPHLRLHDLRHSYASMLVNAGRTLYEVQQILGHSSPDVTTRYAHVNRKTLQDAANSASVIIKGAMPAAS